MNSVSLQHTIEHLTLKMIVPLKQMFRYNLLDVESPFQSLNNKEIQPSCQDPRTSAPILPWYYLDVIQLLVSDILLYE